ncbi:MAG: 3-hydroxyacyl-CoA dehydrogenase, partial [Burkholderiaceae bacterium]|nr:3-hydroxyacyl-CoA dehydrogenase [Burkholderiaceae bacterium]
LAIEGAKHDIRVNCLAPTAATRMTQGLMSEEDLRALDPAAVVPAMLVMASQDGPTRTILCAGAGTFEAAHITLTAGEWIGTGPQAPEQLAERLAEVMDRTGSTVPPNGAAQGNNELARARAAAKARV